MNILKKLLSRLKRSQTGICCLCDQAFSEKKLFEKDEKAFCKEHLDYYKKHNWIEVHKVIVSPNQPEQAIYIQDLKDNLRNEGILSYIKTEYFMENSTYISVFRFYIPSTKKKSFDKVLQRFPPPTSL